MTCTANKLGEAKLDFRGSVSAVNNADFLRYRQFKIIIQLIHTRSLLLPLRAPITHKTHNAHTPFMHTLTLRSRSWSRTFPQ